jgi:DNA replication protein
MAFSGFNHGTLFTPVPNPLFGTLLEQIQDVAEFKVTLRGLWLFHRKRGRLRALYQDEFLNDLALLRGLKGPGKDAKEEIRRGLELAVARGSFLLHRVGEDQVSTTGKDRVYFMNNDAGRAALTQLRLDGKIELSDDHPVHPEIAEEPRDERPNIFALYESNVGILSPLLAEQLEEAENSYPRSWIIEAFRIAVTENKRSWRYIAGILRRWAAEGKDDGKLGRYPQKDNRQKYLDDYQRRWNGPPSERTGP